MGRKAIAFLGNAADKGHQLIGDILPLLFILLFLRRIINYQKKALPVIVLGVLIAGVIMSVITYGLAALLSW